MKQRLGAGLILVWCVSLPILAFLRTDDWGDESGLWESAALWAPHKVRPEVELGRLAHSSGQYEKARQHYLTAIALWERGRPSHEQVGCEIAKQNLAMLAQQQAQFREAAEWSGYRCDRHWR